MPGKSMTPEQLTEAISLRAAGLSLVGIAQRVGISISTLQRAFKRHGTLKGTAKNELVEAARQEMLERVTSDDRIRHEAARLIADDIAHTALLREKMAMAAEHLKAANLDEAVKLYRAGAAYSTVIANTSATLRRAMRFDRTSETPSEELPELVVTVVTDEEARRITARATLTIPDTLAPDECDEIDVVEHDEPEDQHGV
jgi:hypothetical protein